MDGNQLGRLLRATQRRLRDCGYLRPLGNLRSGELDRYRSVPRDHRAGNSIHEYVPLRRPHRLGPAGYRFGVGCWSGVSGMRLLRIDESARSRGEQTNKSMIVEPEIAQIKH